MVRMSPARAARRRQAAADTLRLGKAYRPATATTEIVCHDFHVSMDEYREMLGPGQPPPNGPSFSFEVKNGNIVVLHTGVRPRFLADGSVYFRLDKTTYESWRKIGDNRDGS